MPIPAPETAARQRWMSVLPGTKLPNAYPDSLSHSVNPDVPIVSLADLDATEVA